MCSLVLVLAIDVLHAVFACMCVVVIAYACDLLVAIAACRKLHFTIQDHTCDPYSM